jgi:hypothetical protein
MHGNGYEPASRSVLHVLAWALCFSVAGAQQLDPLNVHAYEPASLESVFSKTPTDPTASIEVARAGEWYRVDAVFTGQLRAPVPEENALLEAWEENRGYKPGIGVDMPEVEFGDGGMRYWLRFGYPASMEFKQLKPGQPFTLFVERVGFSLGRPVVMLVFFGTPEVVARTLAQPTPAEPSPPD